jgi:hypothetical protein
MANVVNLKFDKPARMVTCEGFDLLTSKLVRGIMQFKWEHNSNRLRDSSSVKRRYSLIFEATQKFYTGK